MTLYEEELLAYKSTNQSTTLSNLLIADNELTVTLIANTAYTFESLIIYDGSILGGYKFATQASATPTLMYYTADCNTLSGYSVHPANQVVVCGGSGSGVLLRISQTGTVVVGSSAVTVAHYFGQNIQDSTNTTTYAGSWMRFTQM